MLPFPARSRLVTQPGIPTSAAPREVLAQLEAALERIGSPDPNAVIVKPIYRCAGLCGVEVRSRSDYCPDCHDRERQRLRIGVLVQARASLPAAMAWCKFDNPQLQRSVSSVLAQAAYDWRHRSGSLVLIGPTDCGKTAAMIALGARILDRATYEILSDEALRFASGIRYLSATALATARIEHRLGSTPPLLEEASAASLLLLDNLGQEDPRDRAVLDVLEARHRRPTIVASTLTLRAFEQRYGLAAQRLRSTGKIIDAHVPAGARKAATPR